MPEKYDINSIQSLDFSEGVRTRIQMYLGSDDIEEAQFTQPMLTTIHIPKDEMSKFALSLLLDRIQGGHSGSVKLEVECRLVDRASCDLPENARSMEYYI